MNKTRLLTSMAVFGVFTIPAMADIASNAESATCDSGTIGVSSGSTILEALWTAQTKNCDAGTYLNSTTANCTPCPAGSFCAGGNYTYDGSNVGLTGTCPTDYTSDANATAQSECYRACETTDVAHSTAVSGKYFYGDNNQCAPTSCAKGWRVQEKIDFSNLDYENMNRTAYAAIFGEGAASFNEMTFGVEAKGQSYYDITTKGEWAADFSDFGTVRGTGICSTTQGVNNDWSWTNPTTFANLTDKTGEPGARYCWCNLTGYRASGKSSWISLTSSWVFYGGSTYDNCASYCALDCAYEVGGDKVGFRSALFGAIASTPASCKINTYKCDAGTYLDNATETCVTCPAGSYCAGGDFTYNGNDQGITGTCSGEYNLSDAGSTSINDCYRSCDTTDIANALSVSGKYFYGDKNYCEAETCAAGYTPKAGLDMSDYVNTTITNSAAGFHAYIRANGESYFETDGTEYEQNYSHSYYGITANNTWAWDPGAYTVKGEARCSTIPGDNNSYQWTNPTVLSSLTDETGEEGAQYCYCNMTGYRAAGESSWTSLSSSWVFNGAHGSASNCADNCADICAGNVGGAGFRSALLGSVGALPSTCEANTINIDWYNLGTLLQTNSCTYGQTDIVIPETPSRTGYDFGGWKVKTND